MAKTIQFVLMQGKGGWPQIPSKKYSGDAGWDLYASRPATIPVGETVDVHTDIRIRMAPGLFARIIGRSSTMRTHRLLVTEAIIDNGYTGEMFISIHNVGPNPFEVGVGMRLAQVIFHTIEPVEWELVRESEFREGERGDLGFGSTGMYSMRVSVEEVLGMEGE